MNRRFNRTGGTFPRSRFQKRGEMAAPLASAGSNDAKYFPQAEVANIAINRADLDTIAAALVFVGNPETLSVLRRLGRSPVQA